MSPAYHVKDRIAPIQINHIGSHSLEMRMLGVRSPSYATNIEETTHGGRETREKRGKKEGVIVIYNYKRRQRRTEINGGTPEEHTYL